MTSALAAWSSCLSCSCGCTWGRQGFIQHWMHFLIVSSHYFTNTERMETGCRLSGRIWCSFSLLKHTHFTQQQAEVNVCVTTVTLSDLLNITTPFWVVSSMYVLQRRKTLSYWKKHFEPFVILSAPFVCFKANIHTQLSPQEQTELFLYINIFLLLLFPITVAETGACRAFCAAVIHSHMVTRRVHTSASHL